MLADDNEWQKGSLKYNQNRSINKNIKMRLQSALINL